MHSFDANNNYSFHFNGDYSGDIIITHPDKEDDELVEYLAKFWDR